MAKREQGKLYYEVSNDKPSDSFRIFLSGGAVGSAFVFLLTVLVGVCNGMSMDRLLFIFLISSLAGFGLGVSVTFVFVKSFSSLVGGAALVTSGSTATSEMKPADSVKLTSPDVEEFGKGKSVDFVFPEFTPDK
jgi:hypothetical protein